MNWNFVIGPVSAVFGMLASLYVKDKARLTAKEEFTENIAGALAVFKLELIKGLDDIFVRKGECTLRMEAHDDRLDVNDEGLEKLEKRLNGKFQQ